jgi:hypothetical protein
MIRERGQGTRRVPTHREYRQAEGVGASTTRLEALPRAQGLNELEQ